MNKNQKLLGGPRLKQIKKRCGIGITPRITNRQDIFFYEILFVILSTK